MVNGLPTNDLNAKLNSMSNSVRVLNQMEYSHKKVTFGEWAQLILDRKIVSVKEFLQRPLLKEEWERNDYHHAKEYIASIWRGTSGLDGFSIVPIQTVISKLEDKFQETNINAFKKALSVLTDLQKEGAMYLSLDGQSRSYLSIVPYIKGNFTLNGKSDGIMLEVNGKIDRTTLSGTKYLDLPKHIKDVLDQKDMPVTLVTEFFQFDDIIDTLVNKQKGWTWSGFQQVKQKNRFGTYVTDLVEFFDTAQGKKYSNLWSGKVKNPKNDFKFNRDGHQLFAITMATLLQEGQWLKKVDGLLTGTIPPQKSTFQKVFKYSNEILDKRQDMTKISELINWIVFRWMIDGGLKSNPMYTRLGFTKMYTVKNLYKLLEFFFKQHETFRAKEHPLSWTKVNGEWVRIDQGYSHAQENQSLKSIESRMSSFLNNFDFDKCVSKNYLSISQKMPTINEIIVNDDFKDIGGEDVDVLKLGDYDRSHHESKDNGGSNMLDNLSAEKSGPNRSRGSQNINK